MSKRARAQRRQREAKSVRQQARWPRPRISWKPIAGWGTFAVIGGLLAFALLSGAGSGGSAEADPALAALASDSTYE